MIIKIERLDIHLSDGTMRHVVWSPPLTVDPLQQPTCSAISEAVLDAVSWGPGATCLVQKGVTEDIA